MCVVNRNTELVGLRTPHRAGRSLGEAAKGLGAERAWAERGLVTSQP